MIPKIFAHAPDLAVQPLGKNNAESILPGTFYKAWPGHCIQYRHTARHPPDKAVVHRLVHCHQIFLLVMVSCAHDLIYQTAFICKKKQTL